jgi:asparagine synthase (glutamine-hydrolysing)
LQRRVFSHADAAVLLNRDARNASADVSPYHPALAAMAADLDERDPFDVISAWEMRTYMADVLLRDSDVMSMRHSLELRVPLVDRPLVEWLRAQPAAFKYDPRRPKAALFDATRDLLPPGLERRPKRGFSLPFAVWMRRELRPFLEATFADASVDRSGLFDRRAVQTRWRTFLQSSDSREWSRVWSLAVLIAFVNRPRTP